VPVETVRFLKEETMIRRAMKFAIGTVIAAAFVLSISTLVAPVQASFGGGHCICPDIYAPVTCSNGVTYSNGCVASCAHATGCVPANTI
jgi:F0F1-type ATP synthase assembly protein I